MEKSTEVVLNGADLAIAIKDYIKKTHSNLEVVEMKFNISASGDYNKDNAEEYAKLIYCKCKEVTIN